MIIYNWLIFKDVTLRVKPFGMMNGRDANVTTEDIILMERVQMNGLTGRQLQEMTQQMMQLLEGDYFNIFRF